MAWNNQWLGGASGAFGNANNWSDNWSGFGWSNSNNWSGSGGWSSGSNNLSYNLDNLSTNLNNLSNSLGNLNALRNQIIALSDSINDLNITLGNSSFVNNSAAWSSPNVNWNNTNNATWGIIKNENESLSNTGDIGREKTAAISRSKEKYNTKNATAARATEANASRVASNQNLATASSASSSHVGVSFVDCPSSAKRRRFVVSIPAKFVVFEPLDYAHSRNGNGWNFAYPNIVILMHHRWGIKQLQLAHVSWIDLFVCRSS